MTRQTARGALYTLLALLFVLRHDFWWWHSPRPVLGMPIGMVHQIGICIAASLVMGLLARFVWPDTATDDREEPGP